MPADGPRLLNPNAVLDATANSIMMVSLFRPLLRSLRTRPIRSASARWRRWGLALAMVMAMAAAGPPAPAAAQQLVYEPTNPAFGGSPLNYQWLQSSAQTQNAFEAGRSSFRRDPLADFESSLQRQILNQLSRELIADRFGDDLDLTQEGVFDVGEFTVEVVPGLDGTSIRVFNPLTGEETTVTIPRL
jgi:curli production assembly/transport component CsgF